MLKRRILSFLTDNVCLFVMALTVVVKALEEWPPKP
jgi:hypothetical protein